MSKAKVLVLDIETRPSLAHVWRFWKENIGAKQVVEHSEIMSFACKWLNEEETFYEDVEHQSEKDMLKKLSGFLDEADVVIAHNGDRFDLPTIQGRIMVLGLNPPSPFKTVDTLRVARYEFNFAANSLEYLAVLMNCKPKLAHKKFPGFELWNECLKGNPEAWQEMKIYNIQDVITLEEIYIKMRPFMRRHPNLGVYLEEEVPICPKCGSKHIQRRGYITTNTGKYHRFQCNDCGGWGRSRYTLYPLLAKKQLIGNAG